MPAITWKEEYSVGIKTVDEQHKELFARINKLLMRFPRETKMRFWRCLIFARLHYFPFQC